MSSGSEQRAWRGSRPASISRAPQSQSQSQSHSRASTASPNPSSQAKSTSVPPKPDTPKNVDGAKLVDEPPQKPAVPAPAVPAAAGNIWEQRRNAAQKAKTTAPTPNETPKEETRDGNNAATKKSDGGSKTPANKSAVGKQNATVPQSSVGNYAALNGFNGSEIKHMLRRELSQIKSYKMADDGVKSSSTKTSQSNILDQLHQQVLGLRHQ